MKKLLLLFLFVSCATTLKPRSDRSFTTTKVTLKDYSTAIKTVSQNVRNPEKVIKYKNPKTSSFVVVSSVRCDVLKQSGDANEYRLKFMLDAKYKDNKAILQFNDLRITYLNGKNVMWNYNQISSKENLEKAKQCLNTFVGMM